ncbi:hypothetical protein ACFQ7M_13090 [Streptomyces massasporeus]
MGRPDFAEEPAGPAHVTTITGPDEADPSAGPAAHVANATPEDVVPEGDAPEGSVPSSGPGPDDAGRSGARPFVIRSLDDNPVELRPGTGPASGAPYGDAVSDLVHAAVADRPLEEVVDLIVSLEETPDHTQARVDALRTAGVSRSVEDVSRMIALLTKPPRDADCADEAIRAAAAHRHPVGVPVPGRRPGARPAVAGRRSRRLRGSAGPRRPGLQGAGAHRRQAGGGRAGARGARHGGVRLEAFPPGGPDRAAAVGPVRSPHVRSRRSRPGSMSGALIEP